MINACAKVGSESYNMSLLADCIAAAVKLTYQCYRCGQQGQLRVNCPHKPTLVGTFQGQRDVNIDSYWWETQSYGQIMQIQGLYILTDNILKTRETEDQVRGGDV